MSESTLIPIPESQSKIIECAQDLAYHFDNGSSCLLDIDGVVLSGDSLEREELTTHRIPEAIGLIEALGKKFGVATARGMTIIDYLRTLKLQITGPSILEQGMVYYDGTETQLLVPPQYPRLIGQLRQTLLVHELNKNLWRKVQDCASMSFCPGNYQWQGICRASWWCRPEHLDEIIEIISQQVARLGPENNLDPSYDVCVTRGETVYGLGIVSVLGMVAGEPYNKVLPAEIFLEQKKPIFVADGFGDDRLGEFVNRNGGLVIGIRGNLDVNSESPQFLRDANHVLNTPEEFALALRQAASYL